MKKKFSGAERREFVRFDFVNPLAFKVCKKKTISQLLDGYTSNVSRGGLRCSVKERVPKNSVLWLSFDRGLLDVCRGIERKCLIYQNGVLGKVIWSKKRINSTYDVGIRFITREEKNLTHIYPKIHFVPEFKKAIDLA
jgi:hypothetical protein